ncbi:MAG: hypothetical protein WBQ50_20160, partial [Nocardioides sp.]
PQEPAGQQPSTTSGGQPAASSYPFGEQRPSSGQEQAAMPPASYGVPAPSQRPAPDRRPGVVTAAVLLTWLGAGLVGFIFSLLVLMLLVAQDTLLEAVRQAPGLDELGLTSSDLLSFLWVTAAMALFWCLAAMVLALLAFRRVTWAWGLLIASGVMTALCSLLTLPVGLAFGVPAAVSVGLLVGGRSRHWFLRRRPQQPPGPPSGPPTYGPQDPPSTGPAPSGKPPVW